jgi:pimeloyl-ACP methyl ester carboxylesterase
MNKPIHSLLIALLLLGSHVVSAEELVSVTTPRGVEQRFLLLEPTQEPTAIVLLFAGGKGALDLGKGLFGPSIGWGAKNFLVRTRKDLAKHGFIVATLDAPADRQGNEGMSGGFRTSDAHVRDVDTVIASLRERADLPVWLVGTSRGTESVAYLGIHSSQRPAGIVLTSSMTESNAKGTAVPDLHLERIQIPTLITHHKDDGCRWTRPRGAERIRAMLNSAPVAELALFEGGREQGKPCKAMSHHGYLGIEDRVIDTIAAFIKANS